IGVLKAQLDRDLIQAEIDAKLQEYGNCGEQSLLIQRHYFSNCHKKMEVTPSAYSLGVFLGLINQTLSVRETGEPVAQPSSLLIVLLAMFGRMANVIGTLKIYKVLMICFQSSIIHIIYIRVGIRSGFSTGFGPALDI